MSVQRKLAAARQAADSYRLRALVGKLMSLGTQGNVYGEKWPPERLESLLDEVVRVELTRAHIQLLLQEKPRSVIELSQLMEVPADFILRQIAVLRKLNKVDVHTIDGTTPRYSACG